MMEDEDPQYHPPVLGGEAVGAAPSMMELALIALASGTHRLSIGEDGVELVAREEPDPLILYSQVKKPQVLGKAWVHETPLSYGGVPVELECFFDESFEVGFRLTAILPSPNGGEKDRIQLFSKKDIENGK